MARYLYLYLNRNPRGTTCPECRRRIGRLYEAHERPFLPRHANCYCYYQRVLVDRPPPGPLPPEPGPALGMIRVSGPVVRLLVREPSPLPVPPGTQPQATPAPGNPAGAIAPERNR